MEPSNFNAVDPVVEGTLIEGLKGKKKSKSSKSKSKSKSSKSSSKTSKSASKTSKSAPKPTFIQNLKDMMDIKKRVRELLGISKRVSNDASKKTGGASKSIKGSGGKKVSKKGKKVSKKGKKVREGFDEDDEEGFDDEDDEDDEEGFDDDDEEEGFDDDEEEGFDDDEEEGFDDEEEQEGFDDYNNEEEGFDDDDDDEEGFDDDDETNIEGLSNKSKSKAKSKAKPTSKAKTTSKTMTTSKTTATSNTTTTSNTTATSNKKPNSNDAVDITVKHVLNVLYIPIGIWITFNLYNLIAPMPMPNDAMDTESPLKFFQLIFPIFFIFSKLRDIFGWIQNKFKPLVDAQSSPDAKSYGCTVFTVLLIAVYVGLYEFQILPVFFALISKTLDDLDGMINKTKADSKKVFGEAKDGLDALKSLGLISDKDITVMITILTVIGVVATTTIANPIIGLVATFLYIGMALTLKPVLMLGFSLILIVELTLNVLVFPYPSLTNVATIYDHMKKNASDSPINKWAKNITEFIFSWQILFVISGMSIYAIVDIFKHVHATYRNAAIGIFSAPIVFTLGWIAYKVKLYLDRRPTPTPPQNNAA